MIGERAIFHAQEFCTNVDRPMYITNLRSDWLFLVVYGIDKLWNLSQELLKSK